MLNAKRVQRAARFAGVWGVPKFFFYPAAGGGQAILQVRILSIIEEA